MKRSHVLLPFALAAFIVAPVIQAQQGDEEQRKELFYRVETRLVAIPVYVIDSAGNPVTDLGKDDFEVHEGRQICRIEAIELIDHSNPRRDIYEITPPESRRQFLLLFDLSFTNVGGLNAAKSAGAKFILENTTPYDLIAVLTISQRGGVNLLCPFSTRRSQALYAVATLGLGEALKYRDPAGFAFDDVLEAVEAEITSVSAFEGNARDSEMATMGLENLGQLLEMTKAMDESRYVGVVTQYVRVMEALAVGLQMLHGRKNVVLFSEGFDEKALTGKSLNELEEESTRMSTFQQVEDYVTPSSSYGSVSLQRLFASVLQEFREGSAVFYVVDVGRLQAGNEEYETRKRGQNVLFQFANETSGTLYKNLNNIGEILEDIARRTSVGYLVIFEPSKEGRAGEYRKVGINVKRPGLKLDYQGGYYFEKAYKEFTPQEKAVQLNEYISKDLISQRIPFRFSADIFQGDERNARVPVVIDIEGENILSISGERESEKIELEIYSYLLDSDNRPLDYFFDIVSLDRKQAMTSLKNQGIKYYGLLLAPPGRYKVKCIVRDRELGKISSGILLVTVPDYSERYLQMSGPIFVDYSDHWVKLTSAASQQAVGRREDQPMDYPFMWKGKSWTPTLNPVIDPAKKEHIYVTLYGLELHPTANVPQVSMKFETVDEDQNAKALPLVALADRSEDREKGIYELLFQIDFSQQGLKPGQHWLRFTLVDNLADSEVTAEVPFIVPK